jgi:hypothetical protein
MPEFDNSANTAHPGYKSDILVGDNHYIADRVIAASQTLVAGQVMGIDSATGEAYSLSGALQTTTASGDGAETDFDLGHSDVDPASVKVLVDGADVHDFTISQGTGTGGVDQIIFGAAPSSASDNIVVTYTRTRGKVAGVLLEAVTTGVGETPTMPLVQTGGVKRSELTGIPAGEDYAGNIIGGGLILE